MNAPSMAHLVTSYDQGNWARLMALNCFLSARAFGLPPASYCVFHSASAQLNTKRAVPAARTKYWACSGVGWSLILCALIIREHLLGSGESKDSCQVFIAIVAT